MNLEIKKLSYDGIMKFNNNSLLTVNGGSSSIKFALYEMNRSLTPLFNGKIDSIDTKNT